MGDVQTFQAPDGRFIRLRPSTTSRHRGYVELCLNQLNRETKEIFVPVGGDLDLILQAKDFSVSAHIKSDDGIFEKLNSHEALVTFVRRYFTSNKKAALKFGDVEVFPDGSKQKARRYKKHIEVARQCNLAIDGDFVSWHPELFTGWTNRAESKATKELVGNPQIAVVLHLYYLDLWDEIETLLSRWSFPFKLLVSINGKNDILRRKVESSFPGSIVRVVENRGRDIRPFLLWLEEGSLDAFDVVCKIHGKRSLGGDRLPIFGDIMRRSAFLDLIGNDSQARSIINRFVENHALGIVGPERFHSMSHSSSGRDVIGSTNRQNVEDIAGKMGLKIQEANFDFFEGSMFWLRPKALASLRDLNLASESFASEAGRLDGALEHAVERIFNHASRAAGFTNTGIEFNA